jgi:hypothetical protein
MLYQLTYPCTHSLSIYLLSIHSYIIIKYTSIPILSSTYSLIHSSSIYEFSTCPAIINISLSIHHPFNHPSTYTCLLHLSIYPLIHLSSCIYQSIYCPSTHPPFHASFIHPLSSIIHPPIVNLFMIFHSPCIPTYNYPGIHPPPTHPPTHPCIHYSSVRHPFI